MKHLLITTIAAVLLVGCATTQQPEPPSVKTSGANRKLAEWFKMTRHLNSDAAALGNIEAVKQHIAAGTDVNAVPKSGYPPLHEAAGWGHKEVVELLIAKGTDVNAKNKDGWTPLHHAAINGRKEIAELLIANGADVNAGDKRGRTPLDWAVGRSHVETANLLRKHGGKTAEALKAEGK